MNWLQISLLLCSFGFFREMKPSEPFVIEFLSGEWREVTVEQVNKVIFPIGTYSQLVQLVIVFLVTDILRYKSVIVLSAVVAIIMWILLLWTTSIEALYVAQTLYGTYYAAEVAYYTYIYAKVDRKHYQQVTGNTRAAILCGRFTGDVLGQILVSFSLLNLRQLNFISFGAQIVSLFIAISLPKVKTSMYFYSAPKPEDAIDEDRKDAEIAPKGQLQLEEVKQNEPPSLSWRNAFKLLGNHITSAYTNPIVIQWSIWWILVTCGYLLTASYIQFLWKEIDPNLENYYNGAVDAALTIFSAVAAFSAGFYKTELFGKYELWLLTVFALLEGALVFWASVTRSIWVAYVMYVIIGVIYNFLITVASGIVSKNLEEDSFALIFGINTLLTLILQSLFTIAVISDAGLGLQPRGQYLSFSCYFFFLAALFGVVAAVKYVKSRKL